MRYRPLLAAAVLLGLALALPPAASAGWWDDLDRGQSARLTDLIAQPDSFRGEDVSFFCVFHQVDDVFNPLNTPFNAERYENLAVWADGAPVWEGATFRQDYPFLYLRKSSPQYAELANLPVFTRIEVTGRIRAVHRAMPFIEVLSFRPTGHRLGKLVVQSVMAGDRYAEMGDDELAYENYKRALRPDLPPSYELLVRKRVAEGLRRLGKVEEARALEGGPILADSAAPEARPGARVAPEPDPTLPVADPFGGELPGTPVGPPGPCPPGTVGSPDGAILPAPPPAAIASELPGVPAGPTSPLTADLPGSPIGSPDLPATEEVEDALPPVDPARLPGAPPRRAPRLTGAK